MEKKKGFSFLRFIVGFICVLAVIASVGVNVAFSGGKTPNIMGRYIYVVKEEDTNGVSDVTAGSAILAMSAENISIAVKDIVLCYPAGDPDKLRLCGIYNIVSSDDGTEKYQTYYDGREDNTDLITKDRIKAVCTGYSESPELGAFITFTRSVPGILAELVLPCIILVIFFIAKLASSKDDDEDEYDFYDYNEEDDDGETGKRKKDSQSPKTANPLFEATPEIPASDELEMKKQSIAENFSQKKVNPDSPYQKEKERTMQFKALHADKMATATGRIASADAIKEEMLRKTVEAERIGADSLKTTSNAGYNGAHLKDESDVRPVETSVSDTSFSRKEKISAVQEIKNNLESANKEYTPSRESSSPDISDILEKDAEKKRSASDMSIDDLLTMIEKEKKKL